MNGHAFDQEPEATLFWQKNAGKPYHIDYLYTPAAWRPSIRSVAVGSAADWLSHSDHAPLVMDVDLPNAAVPTPIHGLIAGQ